MKKQYDKPVMEIIELLSVSVICTSGGLTDGTPTDGTGGSGGSVDYDDLFNGGGQW